MALILTACSSDGGEGSSATTVPAEGPLAPLTSADLTGKLLAAFKAGGLPIVREEIVAAAAPADPYRVVFGDRRISQASSPLACFHGGEVMVFDDVESRDRYFEAARVGPTTPSETERDRCQRYSFGRVVVLLARDVLGPSHGEYLDVVRDQLEVWQPNVD